MSVGVPPPRTLAPSGVLPWESSTIRKGLCSGGSAFTVKWGSSAKMVPTPTKIASEPARSDLTRSMSSGEEILTCLRAMLVIFPSAVIAQLTTMWGRITLKAPDGSINLLQVRSADRGSTDNP